jgi:hypothetical protein
MERIVYKHTGEKEELSLLLEGYLYGLGEVCHTLFGRKAEVSIYRAIGSFFLDYLGSKMNIVFSEVDPWKRYCHIVKVFTDFGFYLHVEMEELSEGKYWMLETGQYASAVWEEQKAWERGTPPCPLWSVILHSLAEIGYTAAIDSVFFNENAKGYESTFHFERIERPEDSVIERAQKEIRSALLPICANCKKIRSDDVNWQEVESYFRDHFEANFTHSICPDCAEKLYPQFRHRKVTREWRTA